MKFSTITVVFAAVLVLLCVNVQAQQVSIANISPPLSGSPLLSYGDIVAATRGGTPGFGGGTTYGLIAGWGGVCPNGQYTNTISAQGVPTCTLPTISNSTTFTIASGCGSTTSLTGGGTTGSFVVGQTSCIPVITLPTAPNGWWCSAHDITHSADTFTQTAKSTTSCTLSATVSASDVVVFHAEGY